MVRYRLVENDMLIFINFKNKFNYLYRYRYLVHIGGKIQIVKVLSTMKTFVPNFCRTRVDGSSVVEAH